MHIIGIIKIVRTVYHDRLEQHESEKQKKD